MVLIQATVTAQGGAALLWVVRASLRWTVGRVSGSHAVRDAYTRHDTATYAVFLATLATALGVQLAAPVLWVLLALFAAAQWRVIRGARPVRSAADGAPLVAAALAAACLAGVTVMLYAVSWGRVLERTLGTTAGTSALFVASLLGGLGLGALAAARAARAARATAQSPRIPAGALHVAVALWGIASAWLVPWVAAAASAASPFAATAVIVAVIAVPMLAAGATVPLLAASVATAAASRPTMALYAAAALGAAGACVLSVDLLFAFVGVRSIVFVAAACNVLAAVAVPVSGLLRQRAIRMEGA
jgi:hypothetical protein